MLENKIKEIGKELAKRAIALIDAIYAVQSALMRTGITNAAHINMCDIRNSPMFIKGEKEYGKKKA